MPHHDDLTQLTGRTERLIASLTDAFVSSAEAAAERIELASNLARVQQRMAAFGAVLESVAAAKEPLLARLETATGPLKALLAAQVEALTAQELAILQRVGVEPAQARHAVAVADAETGRLYVRDGRRFTRTGTATNGAANGRAD